MTAPADPNKSFKAKSAETDEPFDYFFDCISFGTDACEGDCDCCDAPTDEIELLCEAKW